MSIELLLQAARDRLRTQLSLTANDCDIQPQGRPPARMGDKYIGLDEDSVVPTGKGHLKELNTIVVVITKRLTPESKLTYSQAYIKSASGLGAIERTVIAALHGVQAVRVAANTLGGLPHVDNGDAIITPLYYIGRTRSRFETGEWAGCEPGAACFMVRELRFQGGMRIQALDVLG